MEPFILPGETGPVSFFSSFRRFGPDAEECAERISASSPEAVFLSIMAFCYSLPALELAAALKQRYGNVPVIAGGAGASVYPGYFTASGAVDTVMPGEAESTLGPLLELLEAGKPFVMHRAGGAAGGPGEHEIAPAAAEDLAFPLSVTGMTKKRVFVAAAATRGCNKSCSFCSVRLHHGGALRKSPPRRAEAEIKRLKNLLAGGGAEGPAVSINFEDDNLFSEPEYAFGLIRLFRSAFPGCSFTSENGLDYLSLDDGVIVRMIDAGFFRFNFSLGTLQQSELRKTGRPGNPQRLGEIASLLQGRGFTPAVFFICGLQGDTPESIVETLLYLLRLKVKTGISLFYPVPGIPPIETENALRRFDNFDPRLSAGSSAYPWNGSLTTAQMITAFRLARLNNLILSGENGGVERVGRNAASAGVLYSSVRREGKLEEVSLPGLDSNMVKLYFANLTSK